MSSLLQSVFVNKKKINYEELLLQLQETEADFAGRNMLGSTAYTKRVVAKVISYGRNLINFLIETAFVKLDYCSSDDILNTTSDFLQEFEKEFFLVLEGKPFSSDSVYQKQYLQSLSEFINWSKNEANNAVNIFKKMKKERVKERRRVFWAFIATILIAVFTGISVIIQLKSR